MLDALSASKPPAAAATEKRVVPEVPRFLPNTKGRKMSTRELWGDSETDNVSETDGISRKGILLEVRIQQLKTLPKKIFLHQKMEVKLTVKVMMWNPLAQITKVAALLSEENRN